MKAAIAPRMMVATLEAIQREFPVFDWRIAGIAIWPLARIRWIFGVWSAAFSAQGGEVQTTGGKRVSAVLRGMRACARARREDPLGEDRGETRRDLVFLSDGISFATVGGTQFERFCDPLIEHAHRLGLTTQMWTPLHLYPVPRTTPSRFIQPAIDRANAYATIEARLKRQTSHVPGWLALKEWLAKAEVDTPALDLRRLTRDAVRIHHVTRLFSTWLAKVRPRAAFVVSYYSLESMAFVRACRQHGIPVTDLQHGVQGEGHGAYAGWGHVPPQGSELLPDHFWVWSPWEAGAIKSGLTAPNSCHPVVGGNPWMNFWAADRRAEIALASREVQALADAAGSRAVVLVTLQFGLSDELQLRPLRDLIDLCPDGYAWWVRLHPMMTERREEVRNTLGVNAASSIWLDLPSDLPLPALLRCVHVHLTHSSSTVIEAASLGIPSVVTSQSGRELFAPLIGQELVRAELGAPSEVARALAGSVTRGRQTLAGRAAGESAEQLAEAFEEVIGAPRDSNAPPPKGQDR